MNPLAKLNKRMDAKKRLWRPLARRNDGHSLVFSPERHGERVRLKKEDERRGGWGG